MLKRLMGIVSQLSVRELLEISKVSENDTNIKGKARCEKTR